METSKKPQRRGGKGKLRGAEDGVPFGKQAQPSPEAKKAGWKKRQFSRDIIRDLLNSRFNLNPKIKKALEKEFGEVDDKTAGELMTLRQIQKAIKYSDSYAIINLLNQAYGQPKQEIDVTSAGQPIKQNVIKLSDGTEISI